MRARRRGWQRPVAAGAAAGALVLAALGAAIPAGAAVGPADEVAWEHGAASTVHDGDTVSVRVTSSSSGLTGTTQRVRTIGIQAPEVRHDDQLAQCGSAQARSALRALLPSGTPVQLRALDGQSGDRYSGGRIVRSIYAMDGEGNWFDTSRQLVSDGTVLWFPLSSSSALKPEYAHNLEYRVLAQDAADARRGLWSANLCGTSPSPAAQLRLAVSWDQSVAGHETVLVRNDGPADVAVAGWVLRDSALNSYRFPKGASVPAGGSVEVRLAKGTSDPARGIYYTGRADSWFTNLPVSNPDFVGDAAYLMDDAGSYDTGNLRAWFPYPCDPDDCVDPLRGKVAVGSVDRSGGQDVPSAPRDVRAAAASDGSGDLAVTWRVPSSLGDAVGVTGYRVSASAVGGGDPVAVTVGASARSAVLDALVAGRTYTVTVAARNAQGWSEPSPGAGPVVPRVAPDAPDQVRADAVPGGVAVRWAAPRDDGGSAVTHYSVQAPGGLGCTTAGPEQSCVVAGLAAGEPVSFTVRAHSAVGGSAPSAASDPVVVGATGWAEVPADLTATPASGSLILTWSPAAPAGGAPAGYVARAVLGTEVVATCSPTGQGTSCVLEGLADGTTYALDVATAGEGGAPSQPVEATPVTADRPAAAAAPASAAPPAWAPRETLDLTNLTDAAVSLVGYGLWDKNPRGGTDTPDFVFPRGASIPAGGTLRVRSGAPTSVEPASDTLLYTGRSAIYSAVDRIELAGLDRAPVSCRTTAGAPCDTRVDPVAPTQPLGVTARTTPSSVTVSWGVPIARGGSPISGYTATAYSTVNEGTVLGRCSTDGAGRSCRLPATVGRTYYVEVTATTVAGTSAPSAPRVRATPRTVPSAPLDVRVAGAPGGARVSWSPAAANGSAVTGYTAEAMTAATGGAAVARCTAPATMSGCTLGGLVAGTRYHVSVTATNAMGASAPSAPRRAVTPTGPAAVRSSYAAGRVTVRWTAPAALGSPVTGYTATLRTAPTGGSQVGRCTATARSTSCVATVSSPRSTYYVHLAVQTVAGQTTTTPLAVTGPRTRSSVPTAVRATAASRRVAVAWTAPVRDGYSAITGYQARLYSKARGGTLKARCSAAGTSCRTGKLKKGTYYVSVRARNAVGWSSLTSRVRVRVR